MQLCLRHSYRPSLVSKRNILVSEISNLTILRLETTLMGDEALNLIHTAILDFQMNVSDK